MFRWLKNYFIPHEENNNQPQFLRIKTLAIVVLLALIFEGSILFQSSPIVFRSKLLGDILSSVLVDQTNAERHIFQLSNLKTNPVLTEAAEAKAKDMAANGYFAHTSPAGMTPWYWFDKFGYKYEYAGENLAVNFSDSEDVTNAWMASPLHRANILNQHYTEIGIATFGGFYEGHEATFVVQLFGTPAQIAAAAAAPAPKNPIVVAEKNTPQATYVAVKNPAAETSTSAPPAVEGAASVKLPAVGNVAETGSFNVTPGSVNVILLILSVLTAAALLIKIFKVGIIHHNLVRNGLLVLFLLGVFVAVNYLFIVNVRTAVF